MEGEIFTLGFGVQVSFLVEKTNLTCKVIYEIKQAIRALYARESMGVKPLHLDACAANEETACPTCETFSVLFHTRKLYWVAPCETHVGKCSPHRIKLGFHMLHVSYVTGEKSDCDFFLLLQSDNCCFTQMTAVLSAVWLCITTELTSK